MQASAVWHHTMSLNLSCTSMILSQSAVCNVSLLLWILVAMLKDWVDVSLPVLRNMCLISLTKNVKPRTKTSSTHRNRNTHETLCLLAANQTFLGILSRAAQILAAVNFGFMRVTCHFEEFFYIVGLFGPEDGGFYLFTLNRSKYINKLKKTH